MQIVHLLKAVEALGIAGQQVGPDDVADLPNIAGAYVLTIHRNKKIELSISSLPKVTLEAGWYVYLGSARGLGGIRSRLQRHFRQDKHLHWHIDRLTVGADKLAAIAIEDGLECDLVRKLSANPDFTFPVTGFGSSDCQVCESHLLQAKLTSGT